MTMGEGADLIKEIEALQDADERLQAAHNALIGITTNVINDLNDECWEYCCKLIREHFGAKEWQEYGEIQEAATEDDQRRPGPASG